MSDAPQPTGEDSAQFGGRVLKGGFQLAASGGAQALVQLVVVASLGRLLTPADFGVATAAALLTDIVTSLSQLGLGPALIQRRELRAAHVTTAFTFSIAIGVLVTIALFLAAPLTAALLHSPNAVAPMRVMSLSFLLSSVGLVANSIAARELKFRLLAARRLYAYLIGYGVVGIGMAIAGAGVWALIGAQLVQIATTSVLVLVGVPHSKRLRFERRAFGELAGFGAGLSADKIGAAIAINTDNIVVSRSFDAVALGLYSRAYNLMRFPALALGAIIDDVAFPSFSAIQHDPDRVGRHFVRGLSILNLFLMPMAAALAVLATELTTIALGPKWTAAGPLLAILGLSLPFRSTQRLCAATARAAGAPWQVAICQYLYIAMVAVGATIGARWGLKGVSAGVGLAIFGQFVALATVVARHSTVRVGAMVKAHLAALPLGLATAALLALGKAGALAIHQGMLATLLVASALAAAGLTTLVLLAPALFLGEHGRWIVGRLLAGAPSRMRGNRHFGAVSRRLSAPDVMFGPDAAIAGDL